MKGLEDEWKEYVSICYPRGFSRVQEAEVRQAFLAGMMALIALTAERGDDHVAGAAIIKEIMKSIELGKSMASN